MLLRSKVGFSFVAEQNFASKTPQKEKYLYMGWFSCVLFYTTAVR